MNGFSLIFGICVALTDEPTAGSAFADERLSLLALRHAMGTDPITRLLLLVNRAMPFVLGLAEQPPPPPLPALEVTGWNEAGLAARDGIAEDLLCARRQGARRPLVRCLGGPLASSELRLLLMNAEDSRFTWLLGGGSGWARSGEADADELAGENFALATSSLYERLPFRMVPEDTLLLLLLVAWLATVWLNEWTKLLLFRDLASCAFSLSETCVAVVVVVVVVVVVAVVELVAAGFELCTNWFLMLSKRLDLLGLVLAFTTDVADEAEATFELVLEVEEDRADAEYFRPGGRIFDFLSWSTKMAKN